LAQGNKGQAQIDHSRVQCIDRCLQIDAKVVVDVEIARYSDQCMGKVGIYAPVADLVRIRQRVSCDPTANAHVVEPCSGGTQTRFDVAQTLSIRELRESHAKKLIPAGEPLKFVIAVVPIGTSAEFL
jgi:hypothetical protein